jgi:THO complex subunit 2
VANQLKDGNNLDLIVLRDLVSNCSGVEAGTDLTQEHLDALGGGDLLKQETGFGSQSKVRLRIYHCSVSIPTHYLFQFQANKKAIARLKDSLLKSNLLEALCILMAQQKNFIVYKDYNKYPLKLTAHMLDQCQETLVQFHQFLRWNMRSEEYMRRVPPIGELLSQEFLPMDSAMFLVRGRYAERIHHSYDALKKAEREKSAAGEEKVSIDKPALFRQAFDSVVEELTKELQAVFPESYWLDISPKLYATFWLLAISDIYAPVNAYEKEIEKCKKALAELSAHQPLPGDSVCVLE